MMSLIREFCLRPSILDSRIFNVSVFLVIGLSLSCCLMSFILVAYTLVAYISLSLCGNVGVEDVRLKFKSPSVALFT